MISALPVAAQLPDPFQRIITFHNSSPATIWPVIQVPQASNCGQDERLRIVVNKDVKGAGIPPSASVDVALPKDYPCANGGYYAAARIFVLRANFDAVEAIMEPNQRTRLDPGWDPSKYPICAGCWAGIAGVVGDPAGGADYSLDAPTQLLEYTIISQNPATGLPFPNPNDSQGRSQIDFDVSYVDSAAEPFAMTLGNGGATQFMGSKLSTAAFHKRLTQFANPSGSATPQWSRYAAFDPVNWATAAECPSLTGRPTNPNKTYFSCMLLNDRIDVVPSELQLLSGAEAGSGSSLYQPSWDGITPKACKPPDQNGKASIFNAQCWAPMSQGGQGLTAGDCCPVASGVMLGCCDQTNFQISDTTRRFNLALSPPSYNLKNTTLTEIVARFQAWQGANDPCTDPSVVQAAPVIDHDQMNFCLAYKKTVDFLWKKFAPQCTGDNARGDALAKCIVINIIGFTLDDHFDAKACKKCPSKTECPAECGRHAQANLSTAALQRGLPWTPYGDPALCNSCPSDTSCPNACVLPTNDEISPQAKLWFEDKFLHFWAPYASVYNINPYARFIHNPIDGLDAPGAYSFSIDDFYGNYGGFASTLIIEAGGYDKMPNKDPYDPFTQYFAGAGPGWDHITVCGRLVTQPAGLQPVALLNSVSFWNNGQQVSSCEVRVYPKANEAKYIAFMLTEVTYDVVDKYTNTRHSVKGLSGAYAPRFGEPTPENPYCKQNSTATSLLPGACAANLAAAGSNQDYVGVTNDGCGNAGNSKGNDPTCGKPLMTLNIPALTATGQ
jgi:hypothetical protein